ncbi:MAG TPA: hypothetical protein VGF38_24205 [Ktedonobacterales bacterium]|jgi:hypothetical protein
MAQFYVYMQWPGDKDGPYEDMSLVAGPYDQGTALRVRKEMEDQHRVGTEGDRDLNAYLYGRENDYTSTDQGTFHIIEVEELRKAVAAGRIKVNYYKRSGPYEAEPLT